VLSPQREESDMAFTKYRTMLTSEDLNLLQKVFDQLCNERRLALKDADQRNLLASELMVAFQDGLTDETELWRRFSKRRAT
jgi:Fe-S cluster biosynthesis and repair protein YggX